LDDIIEQTLMISTESAQDRARRERKIRKVNEELMVEKAIKAMIGMLPMKDLVRGVRMLSRDISWAKAFLILDRSPDIQEELLKLMLEDEK